MRFLFCLLFLLTPFVAAHAKEFLLVSAGTDVTSYEVDPSNGALTEISSVELLTAGPMTESVEHGKIYVNTGLVVEGEKKRSPAIATLTCSPTGELALVGVSASQMSAGYLKVDATGKFIAGSNYGGGQVSVWKLGEGGAFAGELVRTFDLERCAHSVFFAPDNETLYVPATAPNKIFQLKFNQESGEIVPRQPSAAPGPLAEDTARQPRHLIFHPTKPIAYVTHEREFPGAGVYVWNPDDGTLSLKQSILSVDPAEEGMTTADLHLSPDAKYLYVSNRDILNRNDPDKGRDTIALFSVDSETGELTLEERFPCPKVPRSFCRNASGQFLFVSGQGDNMLASYQIADSGHLKEIDRRELSGRPTWVMCVTR